MKSKPRLGTHLVVRRRFACHPGRDAGDRSIGLRNDDEVEATVGQSPQNEHGLTAPGVEWIVDPPFSGVLVGSMSLF